MYLKKKTAIIIVNYNSWEDTLFCVNDLCQKPWQDFFIVIVDNSSINDSYSKISDYIKYRDLNRFNLKLSTKKNVNTKPNYDIKIILKKTKFNGGFAYGNNFGIKVARSLISSPIYIWLLNNDTLTHVDSLPSLKLLFNSDNYGLLGSKILNYDYPHETQAVSGIFNKNFGFIRASKSINKSKFFYPIGASLFLDSNIIDRIGFLEEKFFLYYEELDYSIRVSSYNMKVGVCVNSIVYHKQGSTTKSKRGKRKINLDIEAYKYNGIIKLYKLHFPELIFAAYFSLVLKLIKFLIRFEFSNALLIFKIISKR